MKWGTLYPAHYVNVLFSACRQHTTGDLRFICLTDDDQGLLSEVEVLPLPEAGLDPQDWFTPGVWPKLTLFQNTLYGLQGRALFIDLDMIICGSLDPFFDTADGITAIDVGPNWYPKAQGYAPEVGTGVFAFTVGTQSQIWEAFIANKEHAMAHYANEQSFVQKHAKDIGFWPKTRVTSFKRFHHCRYGMGLLRSPHPPGNETAIVAFHGTPRPIDLIERRIWGRFPHFGKSPVPWVENYWRTHRA